MDRARVRESRTNTEFKRPKEFCVNVGKRQESVKSVRDVKSGKNIESAKGALFSFRTILKHFESCLKVNKYYSLRPVSRFLTKAQFF